jgi:hypothetical protein
MKNYSLILLISMIGLISCDGNFEMQGSAEYENNFQSDHVVVVNGDTIRKEHKKTKSHGGGEVEITGKTDDADPTNDLPDAPTDSLNLKHRIDCSGGGISSDEFENLKEEMQQKMMDKPKLLKAKQLFNERCISTAQVRDLANLFMMDKYKLDFAKFAYGRTTDRVNYNEVLAVFKFYKTGEQLMQYVHEQ